MKIGFKPQTLVKNLATEVFSDNGNTLNRIIEIPATATKPERVLDITYKKGEFIPTQWFVANYNLFKRNTKNVVNKTFVSNKAHTEQMVMQKKLRLIFLTAKLIERKKISVNSCFKLKSLPKSAVL